MKDIYTVLHALAGENRHILSSWRAHIILRREVDPFYPEKKADRTIRKLDREGLIEPLFRKTLYKVTAPYARKAVNIYELANEAYPSGILSHSSALELHRLTDQRSRNIHLYEAPSAPGEIARQTRPSEDEGRAGPMLPPGTSPKDWRMIPLPRSVRVDRYDDFRIKPHRPKDEWIFGDTTAESQGVEVRCTGIERTLIDGLRRPKYCGGLSEVFRGWVRAEGLSADTLVSYAERFDQKILYQRLGFVMETLDIPHERLAFWKENKAPRGGSRVLNPEREYSSNYSDDWNISINHPISILTERDASYS